MTKALIFALFLSQAPIQDVPVFHERTEIVEYINADLRLRSRRVHTIHIHRADLPVSTWPSETAPVPYYEIWDNELKQTAIQYAGIITVLQQELGDNWREALKAYLRGKRKK